MKQQPQQILFSVLERNLVCQWNLCCKDYPYIRGVQSASYAYSPLLGWINTNNMLYFVALTQGSSSIECQCHYACGQAVFSRNRACRNQHNIIFLKHTFHLMLRQFSTVQQYCRCCLFYLIIFRLKSECCTNLIIKYPEKNTHCNKNRSKFWD